MIYELMKRDQAWRAAPWAAGAVAILWLVASQATPRVQPMILEGAFSVLLVLTMGLTVQQDLWTNFLSPLPVTARQVFLARVLAIMAFLWASFLTGAVMRIVVPVSAPSAPLPFFGAYATLLAVALQAASIVWIRLPRWLIFGFWFASFSLPPWLAVSTYHLAQLAVVCLVAAAAIFIGTWAAISGKPLETGGKPQVRTVAAKMHLRPRHVFLIRLRYFFSWIDLFSVAGILVEGIAGNWFIGIVFLVAPRMATGKRWLDSLPVSRRSLLWMAMPHLLLALIVGYLAGNRIGLAIHARGHDLAETTTQNWPPSARAKRCGQLNVMPPLGYWHPATNGLAPAIRAPWGETFDPPVLTVAGTRVYNPYAVGCDNTRQFFDWQFQRAATAVYGRPVTRDDFARERFAPLVPARVQILNVGAILACALLALLVVALKDWYRFQRLPRWLTLGMATLTPGGLFWLMVWAGSGMQNGLLQWLSWRLPENPGAVIALSTGVALLLCLPLDKLIREAELSAASAQTVGFLTKFQ